MQASQLMMEESRVAEIPRFLDLQQQSSIVLHQKQVAFDEEGRCCGCYMFKAYCMCDAVREIFAPTLQDTTTLTSRIEFCLFMHFKEWGRSSNTGKLLNVGLGNERAGIYIFGQEEQERALLEKLYARPSLILYPNKNAKPITEYRHLFDQATPEEPLRLCVVDTTWSLSAAMDRNLPDDIPRVMIDKDLVTGPSRFLNRKQSIHKHKVSTIEAVAMSLQAILPNVHGPTAVRSSEDDDTLPLELQCYRTALEYSVDSVLKQGGKKLAYGHTIVPQYDKMKHTEENVQHGPVTKPVMEKPVECMCCHSRRIGDDGANLDHLVNFKNFGRKHKEFPRAQIEYPVEGERISTKEQFLRDIAREQLSTGQGVTDTEIAIQFRMWRCSNCKEYFPCRL